MVEWKKNKFVRKGGQHLGFGSPYEYTWKHFTIRKGHVDVPNSGWYVYDNKYKINYLLQQNLTLHNK